MSITIEEKFKKDVTWVLEELKQEDLANAYSDYRIKFSLISPSSAEEPNRRSQKRIVKMLADRKAISIKPFYYTGMTILDSVLEMQGAEPIGFYIQIIQPTFNEIFEEVVNQKTLTIRPKTEIIELNPPSENPLNKYFINVRGRQVLINNTFTLSTTNFNSENNNFIDYVISNPNKKLTKTDIEKGIGQQKLKKSLHQITSDLGFRGEIKKLFFDVSKTAIYFRNNISENELKGLSIDKENLNKELSGLDRTDKKDAEVIGDEEKQ